LKSYGIILNKNAVYLEDYSTIDNDLIHFVPQEPNLIKNKKNKKYY